MTGLVGSLVLAAVAVAVIWKGSTYFERAAERLSRYYGLPVAVHGAVVVAVGSSFPEISSVVISTLVHGEFALGVGAIVGSAIFKTSLPDAFGSIRAAQNNDSVTSLTNVLGSNTFNLLVAIPVGVLLAGSATINFLAAIPTMGFLAFATLVFIVFTRTDLELTNLEAYGFLGLYVLFLLWMTLESIGIIETVKGI